MISMLGSQNMSNVYQDDSAGDNLTLDFAVMMGD